MGIKFIEHCQAASKCLAHISQVHTRNYRVLASWRLLALQGLIIALEPLGSGLEKFQGSSAMP